MNKGSEASKASTKNRMSLPTHDEIAQRAYEIYANSGFQPGQCQRNWLQAERDLLQRFVAQLDGQQSRSSIAEVNDDDGSEDSQDLGSSHLHLPFVEEVAVGMA